MSEWRAPALPTLDRFRGVLLGGALGDALGAPYEGAALDYKTERPLRFPNGNGRVSDDTEQTLIVADCLLANGWLDPVDFSARLREWAVWGHGIGRGTASALKRHAAGIPWHQAGMASAGNGAAMRVAPIALLRWDDPALRGTEAALSALPTHHDPMAAASAVIMAEAVARLVTTRKETFDPVEFVETLAGIAKVWGPERVPERRDPRILTSLSERLQDVLAYLEQDPYTAVATHFWSGAFVLESLPAALWAFLRQPGNPGAVLQEALLVGHDTDTVASLAGTLAGALNGAAALPAPLLDQLEHRERLEKAAENLWDRSMVPIAD